MKNIITTLLVILALNVYPLDKITHTLTLQGFEGTYSGPEFNDKGDIAHQFLNFACRVIGKKLKAICKS